MYLQIALNGMYIVPEIYSLWDKLFSAFCVNLSLLSHAVFFPYTKPKQMELINLSAYPIN